MPIVKSPTLKFPQGQEPRPSTEGETEHPVVSEEEVFEVAPESGEAAAQDEEDESTDGQRRRSARKKRKVIYNQNTRKSKKSRDHSTNAAQNLEVESDKEEGDQFDRLAWMIAALGKQFEDNLSNQERRLHCRIDAAAGSLQKSLDGLLVPSMSEWIPSQGTLESWKAGST